MWMLTLNSFSLVCKYLLDSQLKFFKLWFPQIPNACILVSHPHLEDAVTLPEQAAGKSGLGNGWHNIPTVEKLGRWTRLNETQKKWGQKCTHMVGALEKWNYFQKYTLHQYWIMKNLFKNLNRLITMVEFESVMRSLLQRKAQEQKASWRIQPNI